MNINDLVERVHKISRHDPQNASFATYLVAAAILELKESVDTLTAQVTFFENTVAKGMGRK